MTDLHALHAHVADGTAMPDDEPAVIDLQQYAVVFDCPDTDRRHIWGPFVDLGTATKFAEFATAEVDPARVTAWADAMALPGACRLDPVAELLAWRESVALPQIAEGYLSDPYEGVAFGNTVITAQEA
jgi:hypothetical protein